MNILIGENIRRLRNNKKVTQEQLSEVLGVTCAAVSKWERGETYPDITLLFPLAHYFGVSLDELMGYDKDRIEQEIEDILCEYKELQRINHDYESARRLITDAYHQYPNDYRIMSSYMWNLGGDYADNDPEILLRYEKDFMVICDKLLEGCLDVQLRLDAWNMKAKLLHAGGKTEEALAVYRTRFTNWYTTAGQKSEQLFAKDTPEFLYWVKKNMYELARFAADKLVKSIFFDHQIPVQERIERIEICGDMLADMWQKTDNAFFLVMAYSVFSRLSNDLQHRGIGHTRKDLNRILDKYDKMIKSVKIQAEKEPLLSE